MKKVVVEKEVFEIGDIVDLEKIQTKREIGNSAEALRTSNKKGIVIKIRETREGITYTVLLDNTRLISVRDDQQITLIGNIDMSILFESHGSHDPQGL